MNMKDSAILLDHMAFFFRHLGKLSDCTSTAFAGKWKERKGQKGLPCI